MKTDDVPVAVSSTMMWQRLDSNPTLQNTILRLRVIVELLANKISELNPEFTDHSINHLDELWKISDQVLTTEEIDKLSESEIFVLGASFYVHDLGMAMGITSEGAKKLRDSQTFKANYARLVDTGLKHDEASSMALRLSARIEHAQLSQGIAIELIPGLGRYLIEDSDIRNKWGNYIGQVACSHNWSIHELDRILGSRGRTPDPLGGTIDLGLISCLLRVMDYAHINMTRASSLERLLRPSLPIDSLKHWLAQENITGPIRERDQLVFGSTQPLDNVDAWWTLFEMASGLDREIMMVNEYLSARAASQGRFSLDGVKGAKTPQNFSTFVPTSGFEPLDIRFHPDSIERLIGILGGPTLYGNDHYAPLRELLQNSRDAIWLQKMNREAQGESYDIGQIEIGVESLDGAFFLYIHDNGVGMSAHTIANYLLGIAADYWNSVDYYNEYPQLTRTKFRPVGRFGIGFLSIFMLCEYVEVSTQSRGGEHLHLKLYGIGRRGALKRKLPSINYGTTVRLKLRDEQVKDFDNLSNIVMAKAPMLNIPIKTSNQITKTEINPGWWKSISQNELIEFLSTRDMVSTLPLRLQRKSSHNIAESLNKTNYLGKWPGKQPELISQNCRIIAAPITGTILICSNGFSITDIHIPGMIGIFDIGDAELNAARSLTLKTDMQTYVNEWKRELRPHLLSALSDLAKDGNIPSRFEFLNSIAHYYGMDLLIETDLPWITILDHLGNSQLLSPSKVENILQNTDEVLIVYGDDVSPWNAEVIARKHYSDSSRKAIIIPVPMDGQPQPGTFYYYGEDKKIVRSSLAEHFNANHPLSGDYRKALLLLSVISLISKSWSIDIEQLYGDSWIRTERQISCRFIRRDLT